MHADSGISIANIGMQLYSEHNKTPFHFKVTKEGMFFDEKVSEVLTSYYSKFISLEI